MRDSMKAQDFVQKSDQNGKGWPKVAIIILNWNGCRALEMKIFRSSGLSSKLTNWCGVK